MRSGSKNRRSRGRGNGGRWGNTPRNHNFESNGPDGKVRGTAQQVVDKYQALAREATTAGDPIKAEGYFQFAEHYLRVLMVQNANVANAAESQQGRSEAKDRENLENRETVEVAAEVKESSLDIIQKGTEFTEVAEPEASRPKRRGRGRQRQQADIETDELEAVDPTLEKEGSAQSEEVPEQKSVA